MRQKYHLPANKNADLVTKDEIDIRKKQHQNDIREKGGKFYSFFNGFKKYSIWIADGKNVQEAIEKHLKLLNERVSSIRKLRIE